MCYNVSLRRVCVTVVAVEKRRGITYCECVFVVLVIHRAKRMRRTLICVSPPLESFANYLISGTIVELTYNVCFGFLYKFSLKHF